MLLAGKHLYVVEDDIRNRLIYKIMLPQHGATVDFEGWGPDAIKHLQTLSHVDLIILDLMLQRGASGYDIFEEIRTLPEYLPIPIVAVSAAEPGAAIARTRAQGFSGFIAKPLDQKLFPQQLARILAGEPIWYAGARYEGIMHDTARPD